ncbi:MAG: DUF2497 domain-containing protein [Pseudomonadota bacterium]
MSAEEAQQEPTMEEILASIRRIISEDDVPEDVEDENGPAADVLELTDTPDAPAPAAEPEPEPEPDAFDLVDSLDEEPVQDDAVDDALGMDDLMAVEDSDITEMDELGEPEPVDDAVFEVDPADDIDFEIEVEPEPEPETIPEPMPTPAPPIAVADDGLVSPEPASQAAGALGKLMGSMMVSQGGTLDDVVRELLKPMLKEWLDDNLPAIVEEKVEQELKRITGLAR